MPHEVRQWSREPVIDLAAEIDLHTRVMIAGLIRNPDKPAYNGGWNEQDAIIYASMIPQHSGEIMFTCTVTTSRFYWQAFRFETADDTYSELVTNFSGHVDDFITWMCDHESNALV